MKISVTYFFLLLALNSYSQCPPGLNTLGSFYDVMKGNPQTSGLDPGWVHYYAIELNCTHGNIPWYISVDTAECNSCSYSSQGGSSTTIQSYQEQLQTYIKFSAGGSWDGLGGAFSASADFKSMQKGMQEKDYKYAQATAVCTTYCALFKQMPPGTLTPDRGFAYSVDKLPAEYDGASLYNFMSIYGTHYITGVTMGGRATEISTFTSESWQELESQDVNINVAAEADWDFFTVKGQVSTNYSKSLAKTFHESAYNQEENCLPGACPDFSKPSSDWLKAINAGPTAISWTMATIGDAVRQFNFTDGDKKAANLDKYLQNSYCSMLPECTIVNNTLINGTWTHLNTYDYTWHGDYAAVYLNNTIYAYSYNYSYQYNISNNTLVKNDSDIFVYKAGVGLYGNLMAIIGGCRDDTCIFTYSSVQLINLASGKLERPITFGTPIYGRCYDTYKGNIVMLSDQRSTNYLTIVNIETKTVTQLQVDLYIHSAACTILGNSMYIMGGYSKNMDIVSSVYELSLTNYKIIPLTNSTVRVADAASFTFNNVIYLTGGSATNLGTTNIVQIYNPATDSWSLGTSLPTGMEEHSMIKIGPSSVITLGGDDLHGFGNYLYRGDF